MTRFAIAFPGQGSQSVGMLAELAEQHAVIKDTFAEASQVLGYDLCALVLKTGIWPIALAMQTESVAKMPLCIYRVRSRKWIHDVTANKEML